MEYAIKIENYIQKFKNFQIRDVNVDVPKGTIHALIGESGSGKSVIIKSVIGALANYKGTILINGIPARKANSKLSLGFSTNLEDFPGELSAYRFLSLLGELTPLNKKEIANNIKFLMSYFGLWEHRNKKLKSYSSGMKNRIMIIHSMINNPDLMIFDEPGANLDYKNRVLFYEFLSKQKEAGKTIFLTTHMIDEIEPIIDDCTIISFGKFLYSGTYNIFRSNTDFVIRTSNNQLFEKYLAKNQINYRYNKDQTEILATMPYDVDMNPFFKFANDNRINITYFREIKNDLTQLKIKLERLYEEGTLPRPAVDTADEKNINKDKKENLKMLKKEKKRAAKLDKSDNKVVANVEETKHNSTTPPVNGDKKDRTAEAEKVIDSNNDAMKKSTNNKTARSDRSEINKSNTRTKIAFKNVTVNNADQTNKNDNDDNDVVLTELTPVIKNKGKDTAVSAKDDNKEMQKTKIKILND